MHFSNEEILGKIKTGRGDSALVAIAMMKANNQLDDD